MKNRSPKELPFMVYADSKGNIFEHPRLRMAGFSGANAVALEMDDLIPMPEYSKLFFIPRCPPVGLDPDTGELVTVPEMEVDGEPGPCCAVAAFLEPGLLRTHLPAVDYGPKDYVLPMWAYTAVGFGEGIYWTAGLRIEYNERWDPANYDDRELVPAIDKYRKENGGGPLLEHLENCAVNNHCFAAKNLFLGRWEAPLPVSRACNAACLGCLSLQPESSCDASHQRISFRPSLEEVVSLAVRHLERSGSPIVSYGQGCEGEPLTEYRLLCDATREIRGRTQRGPINLNTNGSRPERLRAVVESGLDSVRISLNSARPELYRRYYRPRDYGFEDVVKSISLCRDMDLYTMINYLVFPGVTDQEEEIEALKGLIQKTGVNFIHMKNLNIDPQLYLEEMPRGDSPAIGVGNMVDRLVREFPQVKLGYFNQPVK